MNYINYIKELDNKNIKNLILNLWIKNEKDIVKINKKIKSPIIREF